MSNNAGAARKYNFSLAISPQEKGNDSLINMIIGERSGRQRDQARTKKIKGKAAAGRVDKLKTKSQRGLVERA